MYGKVKPLTIVMWLGEAYELEEGCDEQHCLLLPGHGFDSQKKTSVRYKARLSSSVKNDYCSFWSVCCL